MEINNDNLNIENDNLNIENDNLNIEKCEDAFSNGKIRICVETVKYDHHNDCFTNVETIYGNRLVKSKQFSSSSDNSAGKTLEDSLGVYLSNITLDLFFNIVI